jgi:hypothetical protein
MKRPGTDSAFRSTLEQFHLTAGSPWIAGDRIPSDFIEKTSFWKQNRFSEKIREGEVDASLEE